MMLNLYTYKAECISVTDGDTINFMVDLGMNVFVKERVRLYGIDTPETFGVKRGSEEYKRGMEAKNFTQEFFKKHQTIILETIKDKTGKYGRYLARVYAEVDGEYLCLNDELIKNKLAEERIY